jgi:purine-binding chemotaxis protein CheW
MLAMTRLASDSVVLFEVENLHLALNLESVERVVRSVEISPLPDAPHGILGVVNLRGRIIPVFDPRARFALPRRDVRASDYLIIARMRSRVVALLVDAITGVVPGGQVDLTHASEILPGMEAISGVIKIEGDLIYVHDLEKFLSDKDFEALESVLAT